jgi:hypothetical protein
LYVLQVAAMTWSRWEIRELRFVKPLPLSPRRMVHIHATPSTETNLAAGATSALDVIISSVETAAAKGTTPIVHCTCVAVGLGGPPPPHTAPPPTNDLGESYPVGSLYAQLADSGFTYGPVFRALTSATRTEGDGAVGGAPRAAGVVSRRRESPFGP